MNELLQMVKQVVIFVLIYQVIMNVFSGSSYRKYFQFVEGILLITLMLSPAFQWFHKGEAWLDTYEKNWDNMEVQRDAKEYEQIQQRRDEWLQKQWESELETRESDRWRR